MSKRQATFCFIFFVVHSAMSAQTPFKKIANQPLVAINSIDSDDFADLKFLDTLVQNKRVVFLGESSHYVADFNILKFRLIRYLHQQHGFEVVVFESGVDDCGWSNIMKDSLTDIEMLAGSVKGIWRTRENLPLMNYIRLNHMELAGMDAVGGGYFIIYQNKLIKTLPDPSLFVKLFKIDSLYGREYIRPVMRNAPPDSRLDSMVAILGNEYRHLNAEIVKKPKDQQNLLLRRTVDTRLLSMTSHDNWTSAEFREQQMADNLRFLLDTLYPGKKVIVWAHNGHISKERRKTMQRETNKIFSIPSHLPEGFMDQAYVLGLSAVDGTYGPKIAGAIEKIEMRNRSFERSYSDFNSKAVFIPAAQIHKKKYYYDIPSWSKKATVKELYDGVILLRDVKASRVLYLKDL